MWFKSIETLFNVLAGKMEPPDWLILALFDFKTGVTEKLIYILINLYFEGYITLLG